MLACALSRDSIFTCTNVAGLHLNHLTYITQFLNYLVIHSQMCLPMNSGQNAALIVLHFCAFILFNVCSMKSGRGDLEDSYAAIDIKGLLVI